jgi:uncharacterized protein YukE
MSIELPDPVVKMLSIIGIKWPEINEDKVREFASCVRDFASKVDDTHQDCTATIKKMADVYQGASYDALTEKWNQLSNGHIHELVSACQTVATALDGAADAITTMKGVAIGQLALTAVTFLADQAASVFTFGLAELAEPAIVAGVKLCVDQLEQQIEDHIMSQVMDAAITPLSDVVGKAMSGLVLPGVEAALGGAGAGGGGGAGTGFSVHPEEMHARATVIAGHAQQIMAHAEEFTSKTAGMSFT